MQDGGGASRRRLPRLLQTRQIMMINYLGLLTPQNGQLIIIDHQPQMALGVQSVDRQALQDNVTARSLK